MVDISDAMSSSWKRYLPSDYQLRDVDVICGRGTTCFNHVGNVQFRHVIESHLYRYLNTTSKLDKTMLIYEIVNHIRISGDFVKLDKKNGLYYEVGDYHAREKISQGFRDALHEHYKSSNAKKRIKRKILKSQKAISQPNKSLAIVSPSQSQKSLNKIVDAAFINRQEMDTSQGLMINATFTSLVPMKASSSVLDRLPMSNLLHTAQDDASMTSTSIDYNAILIGNTTGGHMPNFNDESFALKSLLENLTTSFDYQSYESCGNMTAAQRYPSLILDESEETMIMQDDWNNDVMPTDIFSDENNFVISNDRPLLFQSFDFHFDEEFKQILKSFL